MLLHPTRPPGTNFTPHFFVRLPQSVFWNLWCLAPCKPILKIQKIAGVHLISVPKRYAFSCLLIFEAFGVQMGEVGRLPDEEHEVWKVGQHEGGLVPPSAISSSSEGLQLGEQSDSGSDVGDDQMVMLGEHTTQNTLQNTHVDLFGSSRGGGMSSTPLPQCFFVLYNATMHGMWHIHVGA